MASFIDAVGESVNRAACVILGDFAARLEVLNYVLDPLATAPSYNGAASAYAARCGLPLPPDFVPPPPFTGGQCPGVSYRVDASFEYNSNAIVNPSGYSTLDGFAIVPGKVLGTRIDRIPGSVKLFVRFDGGEALIGGVNGSTDPGVLVARNDKIDLVTRLDGNPDNCGDPGVIRPPYEPGSNTYNDFVTYEDNDTNTLTIPVFIALGYATVNIDGTIRIPIDVDFELNPELDFNGEFNFSTGGLTIDLRNPSAPRLPTGTDPNGSEPDPSIPEPPPEIPNSEPPETPPETPPEPERVIVACIVTTQLPGDNESVIEQDNDVDIYAPALGYVQFRIRTGSTSSWTNDIPVKNKRCFIACPWVGGAIDVRGTGRYGNSITVTPVLGVSQLSQRFPD